MRKVIKKQLKFEQVDRSFISKSFVIDQHGAEPLKWSFCWKLHRVLFLWKSNQDG